MNEFEPGDKVKCIFPIGPKNTLPSTFFPRFMGIYTVSAIREHCVTLKEDRAEQLWEASNFRLATSLELIKDRVEKENQWSRYLKEREEKKLKQNPVWRFLKRIFA